MKRTTLAVVATLTLAVAGCGNGTSSPVPADSAAATAGTSAASPSTPAAAVEVTDAWVKAQPDLDHPMTGAFAHLRNTTDRPVTITGATNSLSPVTELHETVTKDGLSAMQKVDGGLVLEPGATRELEPGGDHIMLMKMDKPLAEGESVTITLTTDSGEKIAFDAVAKTFTGGDEKYHSGAPTGMPSATPSTSTTATS